MLLTRQAKMEKASAIFAVLLVVVALTSAKDCLTKSNSKLLCYYGKITDVNSCKCSHIVLPADSDVKSIDGLREKLGGAKILLTVHEFNEGLISVLKSTKVDGLEVDLKKFDSKNDISDFVSTVRTKLGPDLSVVLSVPPKADLLAKYFDFKGLSKSVDLFVLQTAFLGANRNVTFHPGRLSGLWDMQNADSVVDLVSGLGAPLSKLVITAPVQAFHFTLQDEEHTAPGSPALEVKTLTRNELCGKMSSANWTLERDQDQAGPYIFRKNEWIAFDDATSMDIKAKYTRVRGLAGLALKDVAQDDGDKCDGSILDAAYNGLSKQARAPRGAVLHSLEREILERPVRQLDNVRVSPYRISRIIDVEGKVHVIRQDTRTEFECSRQGYFVHPRSCGRFYRCVKFDQLTDEYNVFEFDCPAGLAFDNRVEVCVWPGSLPHASACSGSSEIAPVPKDRFVCPGEQGYYADPENCRWFFACLDHGRSALTAYEFRCPFGLVFDQDRLVCEWPWLVPKCGSLALYGLHQPSVTVHGGGAGLVAAANFVLEQYDGLGSLGAVSLSGVKGPLLQPVAKVYSSFAGHDTTRGVLGVHDTTQGGLGVASGSDVGGSVGVLLSENEGARLNSVVSGDAATYHGNRGYGAGSLQLGQVGSVSYHGNAGFGGSLVGNAAQRGSVRYQGNAADFDSGKFSQASGNGGGVAYDGSASLRQGVQGSYDSSLLENTGSTGTAVLNGGDGFDAGKVWESSAIGQRGAIRYYGAAGLSADELNGQIVSYASGLEQAKYKTKGNFNGDVGYRVEGESGEVNGYRSGADLNSGVFAVGKEDFNGQGASTTYLTSGNQRANEHNQGTNAYSTLSGGGSTVATNKVGQSGTVEYHGNAFDGTRLVNGFASGAQSNLDLGRQKLVQIQQASGGSDGVLGAGVTLIHGPTGFSNARIHRVTQSGYDSAGARKELGAALTSNGFQSSTTHGDTSDLQAAVEYGDRQAYGFENGGRSYQNAFLKQATNQAGGVATADQNDHLKSIRFFGESGVAGNIDIVGGGFSAVKVGLGGGVQVVEQSPVTVTTPSSISASAIPVVTSVPVPAINAAAGFGVYKGGVVANVPELQYKVDSPKVINNALFRTGFKTSDGYGFVGGSSGFANVTTGVVGYASSTPIPLSAGEDGYSYANPAVAFVEGQEGVNVVQPTASVLAVGEVGESALSHPSAVSFASQQAEHVQHSIVQPTQSTLLSTPTPVDSSIVIRGYHYPKPSLAFEEKPLNLPLPVGQGNLQSSVVSSHNYQQAQQASAGYVYNKPSVVFEEEPRSPALVSSFSISQQPSLVKTGVPLQQVGLEENGGFEVARPSLLATANPSQPSCVKCHIKPVVSSYYYGKPATVGGVVDAGGYVYDRPSVAFEEERPAVAFEHKPTLVLSQPVQKVHVEHLQPIVPEALPTYTYQKRPVQPALSYSYQNVEKSAHAHDYDYSKSTVVAVTPATVNTYTLQQPAGFVQKIQTVQPALKPVLQPQIQPVIQPVQPEIQPLIQTVQPLVQPVQQPNLVKTVVHQPAVVNTYHYQKSGSSGYTYPKPSVQFVEEPVPVVTRYEHPEPVEEVPFVAKKAYVTGQRASQPESLVQLVEEPAPVVTRYENLQPVEEVAFVAKKAYVTGQRTSQAESQGYVYRRPQIRFEERPGLVETYPLTPSVVSSVQPVLTHHASSNPQPIVFTTASPPTIRTHYVSSTPKPIAFSTGSPPTTRNDYVSSTPQPIVFSTASPPTVRNYHVSATPQPFAFFTASPPTVRNYNYYVSSTPKPTYTSTVAAVVAAKTPVTFYSYDSRLVSPARPITPTTPGHLTLQVPVTHSRPISRYSFSSLDDRYNSHVSTPATFDISSVVPVKPAVAPLQPLVTVTTSRPISQYSFSSLDREYNNDFVHAGLSTPVANIRPVEKYTVTTPANLVQNVDVTFPKTLIVDNRRRNHFSTVPATLVDNEEAYVDVSTSLPPATPRAQGKAISRYSFSSLDDQYNSYVSTQPASVDVGTTYLTTSTEPYEAFKVTRTYLPPVKTTQYVENFVSTKARRPVKVVKVVRPKSQAIVKVNDFHPLLSAKLGAQCTCVSNTLRLRNKPIQIDDDDEDEYVVKNVGSNLQDNLNLQDSLNLQGNLNLQDKINSVAIEDYKFEPERVVAITPEVSTSRPLVVVRKRVRVRPYSSTTGAYSELPVTKATDLFLKSTVTPAVQILDDGGYEDDDVSRRKDFEDVVRKGLSLIKSAAKQGAKEALASHTYDRFGPGGVRSRDETLQGTVDCQRAGLFRHPEHCNKFYACRWDCTKNRFTLHVFNCPVHLTFDGNLGACNWPSQGPACLGNTLLPND